MNDDPVALLNLQTEPAAAGSGSPGKCWVASILSLAGLFGGGVVAAFSVPQGSGSLGLFLMLAGGGLILGAFFCLVFAIVSLLRREAGSFWALLAAMPCALLFAWMGAAAVGEKIEQRNQEDVARERAGYLQQLRADPEIALREHWAGKTGSMQLLILSNSLQDASVRFSLDQLQRIYREAPQLRARVLANAACTAGFLTACLPDAAAEPGRNYYSYSMLEAIVQNPHTPLDLLETMAHSAELPPSAAKAAGEMVDRRQPSPLGDRFASFRQFEAEAGKKYLGLRLRSPASRINSAGRKLTLPVTVSTTVPSTPYNEIKTERANVFVLSEVFNMDTGVDLRRFELAQAFAIEHNAQVARQAQGR